ncbi:hypothetical protein [Dongia sp.]|uniref:hypothetical protein n=1 Tax=Dongia sp. TaxID=1977262 RepID=UPI0035AF2504
MRRHRSFAGVVASLSLLLVAACAGQSAPTEDLGGEAAHKLSREELFDLLPDREEADCTGSLEFATDRRFEGESSCGRGFRGHSDDSLTPGTICVYSSTLQSRGTTEFIAIGHFACSDDSRGSVRFQEQVGNGPGTATVTANDGRVVTLNYE